MILTGRLQKIAQLVPKCDTIADVGTDHGYIPVYCVQNGICKRAIAMDINEKPLAKSQENIIKYGLSEKIETRLSNGVQKLKANEANCIVIAGMGGLLIRDILNDGKNIILPDTTLVLQPMIAVRELREFLAENAFDIQNEYVCREENKFYNIITVVKCTENTKLTNCDIIVGKNLYANSCDTFIDYVNYKIGVITKIINGLKMSSCDKTKEIEYYSDELYHFETVKNEVISK